MAELIEGVDPDSTAPVKWIVEDLYEETGRSVPYERVIQTARRELLIDRADVESDVEALRAHSEIRKVRGDYLRPARSSLSD